MFFEDHMDGAGFEHLNMLQRNDVMHTPLRFFPKWEGVGQDLLSASRYEVRKLNMSRNLVSPLPEGR